MQGILKSSELKPGMKVQVYIRKVGIVEGVIGEIKKEGFRFQACGKWIYWAQCPMIVAA